MGLTTDRPERRRALARESNRLLSAVDELKALELRRRRETISTPPFHRLADDVKAKSREIFRMADGQEQLADRTPTQQTSIDDTNRVERLASTASPSPLLPTP